MVDPPAAAIETPCINICIADSESGLCLGCYRTLAEIAHWTGFSPEERRRIMDALPGRRSRIAPEKLGLLR
ncbi:MAG TPA: DUF1289 domain-containing protein [Caulobacteraceae bacterium]|nr:DUF1289 domain-containing protein [Caulobacteraceae bacterium]